MGGTVAERLPTCANFMTPAPIRLPSCRAYSKPTHFLTRVKVAPAAQGFFDGGSGEARRAGELAAQLSVPALTRAWQMLLKGLLEVRDATREADLGACEIALIRLAYAADLPPADDLSAT